MEADAVQAILGERRNSRPLKKKSYKGVLKRYTQAAASAMKGAGY